MLALTVFLLVMLAKTLFSYEQKSSEAAATAIPDPIWRNDYDWSSLKEQDGHLAFEDDSLHTDDYFTANMEGASAAGIETDVYWFSQAVSVEEAKEEAAYVLNLISPYTVGTVAFDMEIVSDHDRIQGLNAEEKTAIAAAFCRVMKEAGYSVLVYGVYVDPYGRPAGRSGLLDCWVWGRLSGFHLYVCDVAVFQYRNHGWN